jgi:hypothetical protein
MHWIRKATSSRNLNKNKNKSSRDTPPRDTSPSIPGNSQSNNIPNNILAFRTITTLLAMLQQERHSNRDDIKESVELKLSNAFSTLAVMNHDVVAIVSNYSPPDLSVLATRTADTKEVITSSALSSPEFQIFEFLTCRNNRKDEQHPTILGTSVPTIHDGKSLAQFAYAFPDDDDEAIRQYADEYW